MMKQVKLNTVGVKFTPSTFITYYEVDTNYQIQNETELLACDEVKAVLNHYQPIVKENNNGGWSIGVCTPLKEMHKRSFR